MHLCPNIIFLRAATTNGIEDAMEFHGETTEVVCAQSTTMLSQARRALDVWDDCLQIKMREERRRPKKKRSSQWMNEAETDGETHENILSHNKSLRRRREQTSPR